LAPRRGWGVRRQIPAPPSKLGPYGAELSEVLEPALPAKLLTRAGSCQTDNSGHASFASFNDTGSECSAGVVDTGDAQLENL
jgi:hypothetical protein